MGGREAFPILPIKAQIFCQDILAVLFRLGILILLHDCDLQMTELDQNNIVMVLVSNAGAAVKYRDDRKLKDTVGIMAVRLRNLMFS